MLTILLQWLQIVKMYSYVGIINVIIIVLLTKLFDYFILICDC